jgi:2-oxoglutarate ferredoxin oxidoreductase subunit beta
VSTTTPAGQPVNRVGLTKAEYDGSKTTLCPGCGHNAITGGIIQAAWEAGLEPHRVAKLSGIGCSSKTPAYFLGHSHGFNAVQAACPASPPACTPQSEAALLITSPATTHASGLGQFCHLVRLPVVYIVENSRLAGSPRASATADVGAMRGGKATRAIDCAVAIELAVLRGALVLGQAAAAHGRVCHPGTAVYDWPCAVRKPRGSPKHAAVKE